MITSVILTLGLVGLFFAGYFKPKGAGLIVNSTPAALVFVDGVQVGRTSYKATLEPKEITLRLVPEPAASPLAVFETKLNLTSGIETVVNREIGETEEASAGEVVSFEKVTKNETSLSIISVPDAAQISVDGAVRGFAPYKTSSIISGEHQVIISAPGYNPRTLQVKTREGYKLIIITKLSVNLEEKKKKEEEVLAAQTPRKVYVEILDTPTGFLRVRQEASTSSVEIGQVKPGEKYEFLEEVTNWFKIKFSVDKDGWISSLYAKKLEEAPASPSPSPTASPKASSSPTGTPKPTGTPGTN